MASENHTQFSFADVTVDCENFRVLKAGAPVTLTPRAFDVLVALLRQPGRVVDKKELFDQVWGETHVTDNALTKIIKEIRHTLDDDANAPRYIETVPKRGYRFIAAVVEKTQPEIKPPTESTHTTSRSFAKSRVALVLSIAGLIAVLSVVAWLMFRQERLASTRTPILSIAVLPFKPLNADSRDESLEMGMADALITRLSSLRQLVVRPMSAVRKYTDLQQDPVKAGQEVQAAAVLDGSIQKVGERIRVTVRLISVSDGKQVWSEQFDENFTDIFKVQDSIAERITTALTLQLSKQEKEQLAKHLTNDPEAYQLYLRAQLLWNGRRQKWIEQSLAYYQQAVERDPNFALAHIGVADSYIMLSGHNKISPLEAETNARPSIARALELDDSLAQAHNAWAELKYQFEYDWTGAETEFKKAIELNPNVAWIRQAYGWFLMSAGRFDEATSEMEKARELDPSSLTINVGRGKLSYYLRQYDQAAQQFQNVIAVEPDDGSAYFALYAIYEQKGMPLEAVDAFVKAMELFGAPPGVPEQFREAFRLSGWQGFLRKRLELLKASNGNAFLLAHVYTRLGEKDKAFEWLEKALAAGDPAILQFKIEPAFDSLRNDSRYAPLIRKIGLQP